MAKTYRQDICSICLSRLKRPIITLDCGHKFHKKCLKAHVVSRRLQHDRNVYVLRSKNPNCPYCRKPLGALEKIAKLIGVKKLVSAETEQRNEQDISHPLKYYKQTMLELLLRYEKQPVCIGDIISRDKSFFEVVRVQPDVQAIGYSTGIMHQIEEDDHGVDAILYRTNPQTREQLEVFHHLYIDNSILIDGKNYTINRFRKSDFLAKHNGQFYWIKISIDEEGQRNFQVSAL